MHLQEGKKEVRQLYLTKKKKEDNYVHFLEG